MLESLRKTLLASLGAVSFTREKLVHLFDELVGRGELTAEQAKKVLHTLLSRGESEHRNLVRRLVDDVDRVLARGPLVTRAEYRTLKERVEALEHGGGAGTSPLQGSSQPRAAGGDGSAAGTTGSGVGAA